VQNIRKEVDSRQEYRTSLEKGHFGMIIGQKPQDVDMDTVGLADLGQENENVPIHLFSPIKYKTKHQLRHRSFGEEYANNFTPSSCEHQDLDLIMFR
jgi:hypothetical protein